MTELQAEFDRKADEYRRLMNTPLPDGWLEICMDAGFPGLPHDMTVEEAHRRIRAIVNSVLPLHETKVRAEVAEAIADADDACGAPVCECCQMQREVSVMIARGGVDG